MCEKHGNTGTEADYDAANWYPVGSAAPVANYGFRFDPKTADTLGAPSCGQTPAPALDKSWQVSAPRTALPRGARARLGLRNKYGNFPPIESFSVLALVIAPDGSWQRRGAVVRADTISYLDYDQTNLVGAYTVIWETGAGFLACDGFVIR